MNKLYRYGILVPLFASIFLFSGCVVDLEGLEELAEGENIIYEELGTKEVIIEPEWSKCQIEVDNSVGEVSIQTTDETVDYMLKATTTVYGRKSEGSVTESNNLTYNAVTDDTVRVEFSSTWKELVQNPPYYYDLEIVVSKGISLEIAVDLSVGTLRTTLSEVTIEGLDLDTSTGRIDLELSDVIFRTTMPKLHSSTGQIRTYLTNINYELQETNWLISASTGQIYVTMQQDIPDQGIRNFDIRASTGGIIIDTKLPEEYGVKVNSDSNFGDLSVFGNDVESYTSSNYGTASVQYEFELDTATGKIVIR